MSEVGHSRAELEARIAALTAKVAQSGVEAALSAEQLGEERARSAIVQRELEFLRFAVSVRDERIVTLKSQLETTRRSLNALQEELRGERQALTRAEPDPPHQSPVEDPAFQQLRDRACQIALPVSDDPYVSVVIPMYGEVDYVVRLLESIQSFPPIVPIEVIISDDASPNPHVGVLEHVKGLRLLRQPVNLEFIRNCNAAAAVARGKYILFLNADTEVTAGWLDTLVDVFRTRANVAIAGSKLVFADGSLQEAGGIMWQDGSAWNYGRLSDPNLPPFNYLREVDYISGASILVDVEFFRSVGGFDEYYVPAYCEDADLSFKAHAAGKKVYYQPASVIVHYEGIAHGTDESQGTKAYQVINKDKFRERWKEVLEQDHFPNAEHVFLARDRSRRRACILVVDHYIPQPDRDAGSRTMIEFVRCLVQMGLNVKFWPQNLYFDPEHAPLLLQEGVETLYGPQYVDGFESWMRENGQYLDYVLLSRPHVSIEYIDAVREHSHAKILYYGHDLHHLRVQDRRRLHKDDALAEEEQYWLDLEQRIWRAADVMYYPSDTETAYLAEWLSTNGVEAVARTIPAYAFAPLAESPSVNLGARSGVIFVAGFAHPPNVDAAKWFVCDILPKILERRPNTHLSLVGSNPTAEVLELAGEHVTVTGTVSDEELARYYNTARVAVAPLRWGAGVKGKVVEAMHNGLPIVTTSAGIQGMAGAEDVIVASDLPDVIAESILTLLSDDDRWRDTSQKSQAFIAERYSRAAIERVFRSDVSPAKESLSLQAN